MAEPPKQALGQSKPAAQIALGATSQAQQPYITRWWFTPIRLQ